MLRGPTNVEPVRTHCVFSIDVEDWFHILDLPSAPRLEDWESLPSRVERNFRALLELTAESGVRATCFFLGWVAERYPHLVVEADSLGHEIASHGWAHRLVFEQTPREFYEDVVRAKEVLEQTAGRAVLGYRSPGFSLTGDNDWVFDSLLEAGYVYDASVFPAPRAHGGWETGRYAPYRVERPGGTLLEFPMSVKKVFGRPVCFFGGGYLRLFPLPLVRRMTRAVLQQNRPAIFYIHPREIDPSQPRLPMDARRRFKTYVNLKSTEGKLRRLLTEFSFTTLEDLARDMEPMLVPSQPHWRIVSR